MILMSASTKKKLRKEQVTQMMTERQQKEKAEAKKTKAITAAFIIVIVAVFCVCIGVLGSTLFNRFGVIERFTTAATIGDHELNSIEMNYFFYDAVEAEYNNLFANPYQAAKYGYIDDVIEPRNTRFRIIRALAQLESKRQGLPEKKHGNIPL